ncbi:MAG TPA: cyclic nucleotide-binding domain-containing protein, partial [Mucilaginibacter sp.]
MNGTNKALELLRQNFSFFDPSLQEKIARVAILKVIAENEVVLRSGEFMKYTMLLAQGKINLYRQHEDGGELFMYQLKPGTACALSIVCSISNKFSEVHGVAEESSMLLMV